MSERRVIGPYTAYTIAVKHGYTGTEAEWVAEQNTLRDEAAAAATQANAAAADAENAASEAKTAAANAKLSASNIAEAEANAKASAEAAALSETNAGNSAADAETSKNSAAGYNLNASNNASKAAASATAAGEAQTAAEAAKDAAQTILNSIPEDYSTLTDHVDKLGIECEASGEEITITDSANLPVRGLSIFGKSEQDTTTGKNLVNLADLTITAYATSITSLMLSQIKALESGTIYVSSVDADVTGNTVGRVFLMNGSEVLYRIFPGEYFVLTDDILENVNAINIYGTNPASTINIRTYQIEKGNTPTGIEPYTGGAPSPSPDYPQEITHVENPVVKVRSKNLFGGKALADKIVEFGGYYSEDTGNAEISASRLSGNVLYSDFKENTAYTIILNGINSNTSSPQTTNLRLYYTDGTDVYPSFGVVLVTSASKTIDRIEGFWNTLNSTFYTEQCGIFEGVLTADDFEAYTEQTAELDYTLRAVGDYADELVVYADGTGKFIQRIRKAMISDMIESLYYQKDANVYGGAVVETRLPDYAAGLSNKLRFYKYNLQDSKSLINRFSYHTSNLYTRFLYMRLSEDIIPSPSLEAYQNYFTTGDGADTYILFVRNTPVETDLTAEEVAAVLALNTLKPATIITNDQGATMSVSYTADPKTYIDNKFAELATAIANL